MNAIETEKEFITNFIRKEKRERSIWTLSHKKKRSDFIDKFNHNWNEMIVEKNVTQLQDTSDAETYATLKSELNLKDTDICYIISHNDAIDGQFLELQNAFKHCQNNGFAELIISENGKKFYLKTEQEFGAAAKFIGKIK
ncbi:hypothetical protein [uncultured Kordia sp.]|uniref:hypothetical protein n=1 Tax=uncultured Kordia sp. TaxID=507699 RepID=UPI0026064D1D|nr:hypothetical protein [uncultured Kordia sp.]